MRPRGAGKRAGLAAAALLACAALHAGTGFVFDDRNGDGRREPGEPGLPSVAVSNGVDFQHLRTLHGFPGALTPETLAIDDHSIEYRVGGGGYTQHGRISGTNCFAQYLKIGGNEMFMLFAGCSLAAGKSVSYYVIGVRRGMPVPEQQGRLAGLKQFVDKLYAEDAAVLDTIRFRKGVLVASDRHLARFLKYVDNFPRAELPAA